MTSYKVNVVAAYALSGYNCMSKLDSISCRHWTGTMSFLPGAGRHAVAAFLNRLLWTVGQVCLFAGPHHGAGTKHCPLVSKSARFSRANHSTESGGRPPTFSTTPFPPENTPLW